MYKKVHYIQPCCAGARLLRWPLARLISLAWVPQDIIHLVAAQPPALDAACQ